MNSDERLTSAQSRAIYNLELPVIDRDHLIDAYMKRLINQGGCSSGIEESALRDEVNRSLDTLLNGSEPEHEPSHRWMASLLDVLLADTSHLVYVQSRSMTRGGGPGRPHQAHLELSELDDHPDELPALLRLQNTTQRGAMEALRSDLDLILRYRVLPKPDPQGLYSNSMTVVAPGLNASARYLSEDFLSWLPITSCPRTLLVNFHRIIKEPIVPVHNRLTLNPRHFNRPIQSILDGGLRDEPFARRLFNTTYVVCAPPSEHSSTGFLLIGGHDLERPRVSIYSRVPFEEQLDFIQPSLVSLQELLALGLIFLANADEQPLPDPILGRGTCYRLRPGALVTPVWPNVMLDGSSSISFADGKSRDMGRYDLMCYGVDICDPIFKLSL